MRESTSIGFGRGVCVCWSYREMMFAFPSRFLYTFVSYPSIKIWHVVRVLAKKCLTQQIILYYHCYFSNHMLNTIQRKTSYSS
jgi:hypothetical protein